jgi:serine/threonine protein kinase
LEQFMHAQAACPESKQLRGLLEGGLARELETQLADHLSSCGRCQRVLESLTAQIAADVGQQLRPGRSVPSMSEGLQQAIQQLLYWTPLPEMAEESNWTEEMLLRSLDPSPTPGHLGRLGAYEVVAILGRGGFGVVFKAFDATLNRFVALKVLAPHLASNAAARKRFAREARAAAAVRDEHVVAIHGVEEAKGLPYLVMEYISGISLQQRLDSNGPLAVEEIVRIGRQTAAGLAAAHAQGLIHRDIKPANILLENKVDRVKITDFGLARAADDAGQTQSGVLAGTPQYMAPEQARGEPLDHRADLFSLGSVLYALGTGRPPFRAANTLAILRRINEETPQAVRQINPSIPPWLEEVIARLQAKEPSQRFSSAAEVADLFDRYLAYLQQPATGAQPAVPPQVPHRRRNRAWHGPVATACLLGALLLFALAPIEERQPEVGTPRVYQDFRGRPIDTHLFRLAGPKARQQMTVEPEGLRIALPAPGVQPQPTGLIANFPVSGDFEITTSYELLQADKPANGFTVGVQLYLLMESPTQEAVLLGRFNTSDQGDVYNCARLGTHAEGKRRYHSDYYPTGTRAGRLRLARRGSLVSYLVAEAEREEFREIHKANLGTDDLKIVRVAADTGNSDSPVEVRIGDLEIRALKVPAEFSPPPSASRRRWFFYLYPALALLTISLLLSGSWLWQRRRHRKVVEKAVTKPLVPAGAARSKSVTKDLRQS